MPTPAGGGTAIASGWRSKLTREELEAFFLHDYQPTPIFNPWGARSGFYDGPSEKSARESLKRIEHSSSPRLEPFRTTIKTVRSIIAGTTSRTVNPRTRKRID